MLKSPVAGDLELKIRRLPFRFRLDLFDVPLKDDRSEGLEDNEQEPEPKEEAAELRPNTDSDTMPESGSE
jgi:hypothetical protein